MWHSSGLDTKRLLRYRCKIHRQLWYLRVMDEEVYLFIMFMAGNLKLLAGYNLINIRYELSVLKKRVLTYSAHLPICAKNANLTEKQAKSDILCDLLTHNISLFSFYTSYTQSKQNFFNPDCKFSCNAEESLCCCEIISKTWRTADKQHNAFVFWEVISFWIEHWHLVYIRYP